LLNICFKNISSSKSPNYFTFFKRLGKISTLQHNMRQKIIFLFYFLNIIFFLVSYFSIYFLGNWVHYFLFFYYLCRIFLLIWQIILVILSLLIYHFVLIFLIILLNQPNLIDSVKSMTRVSKLSFFFKNIGIKWVSNHEFCGLNTAGPSRFSVSSSQFF